MKSFNQFSLSQLIYSPELLIKSHSSCNFKDGRIVGKSPCADPFSESEANTKMRCAGETAQNPLRNHTGGKRQPLLARFSAKTNA